MASRKRQTEINEPIKAKKAKKETARTSKTSKAKASKQPHAADVDSGTVRSKYLKCLARPPSKILWPYMVQFSGKFCGTQKEMHDLVEAHGGKIGSKKVFNLLVATLAEYTSKTNKVLQAEKKHEPIVHELYLYDTILRDGKPDISLYDLSKYKASSGTSAVVEEDDDEDEDVEQEAGGTRIRDTSDSICMSKYAKALAKPPSNVLRDHTITFSGKFSGSQKQMQDLVKAHGAKLGTKTTFSLLIASSFGYDAENSKVLQAEIKEVPILHEMYLYDAIINGKVPLSMDKYDLSKP